MVAVSFETQTLCFRARWATSDCQLWSVDKRSFVQVNFQFGSFSAAAEVLTFCCFASAEILYAAEEMTFNSTDMSFPSTTPLSDTQPLTAPTAKK